MERFIQESNFGNRMGTEVLNRFFFGGQWHGASKSNFHAILAQPS